MKNLKFKNSKYIFFMLLIALCVIMFFKNNDYTESKQVSETITSTGSITNFNDAIKLPVIMYHNISEKQRLVNKYCVSTREFENDLKYIKEHGYTCIGTAELIDYVYNGKELPKNPFMITFDDGYESFYKYAYPLLKKYNMKAVMSIVGAYTDLYTNCDDHNVDYSYLNWKEVNELNNSNFAEIQNHTYNMHEITATRKGAGKAKGESFEQFKKVFEKDTKKLNDMILSYTGKKCTVFTYPYGNIAEKSDEVIKDMGFLAALTCSEQVNIVTKNPDDLYKIGRFNRDGRLSTAEFFAKIDKSFKYLKSKANNN